MTGEGPLHVLADERGRVLAAAAQSGDDRGVGGCVAERDGDVAQPTFVARAAQRASFRLLSPLGLAPREQLDEIGAVELMAHRKVSDVARACELVPWAEELAIVAAENPIADRGTQ